MIKLSDKAKIILAVLAVVTVAAGAIAVVAATSNASGVQSPLQSDGGSLTPKASGKTQIAMPVIDDGGKNEYTGEPLVAIGVTNISDELFGNVIDMSVEGTDCEGDALGEISIADVNVFDVLYAGTYVVTLTIRDEYLDRYEWAVNPESPTATATYVVKQKPISGNTVLALTAEEASSGIQGIKNTDYLSGMTAADLLKRFSFEATDNLDKGKYKCEYTLYSDSGYSVPLTELAVGTQVYAKVTGLLPASDGDKEYRNYRLPERDATYTFKLTCPPLIRPSISLHYYDNHDQEIFGRRDIEKPYSSGNGIIATYANYGYKVSQWFCTNEKDLWSLSIAQGGHESGKYWDVKVSENGGTYNEVDPNTYEMKDVGKYDVKITAKTGFKFLAGTEYNFTLTINPYVLSSANIEVIDNKREYTGESIVFGEEDYRVVDLFGEDTLTFSLECHTESGVSVDAGYYDYAVKSIIGGSCVNNYVLPDDTSTITLRFTIYKKTLRDFKQDGPLVTGVYNGDVQHYDLTAKLISLGVAKLAINSEGKQEFTSVIRNVSIAIQFNGKDVSADDANFEGYEFVEGYATKRRLNFKRAGNYSVTFQFSNVGDIKNYCWFDGDSTPSDTNINSEYVWTDFAVIDGAEIDPMFEPTNILSTSDETFDIAALIKAKFIALGFDESACTIKFGSEGSAATSDTPLHGTAGHYTVGDYFVTVEIDESLYPDVYFKQPSENDGYTVDGRTARVGYTVTSTTVSVKFTVSNYTFGANFDAAFKAVSVTTNPAENVTYNEITVTYYNEQSEVLAVYVYDNDGNLLSSTDANSLMLNGSPRNAGTYYVGIAVEYTVTNESGTTNETYTPARKQLTVSKRTLTLGWTLDGNTGNSLTYDKNNHTVAVSLGNTVTGAADVSINLTDNVIVNAGTYDFSVNDGNLVGAEKGNYTLSGVSNVTFSVTVDKAAVTVTAGAIADIVFGKPLSESSLTFSASESFEGIDGITVAVYNGSKQLMSAVGGNYSLNRGGYTLVPVFGTAQDTMPVLSNGSYQYDELLNYVVTLVTSTFAVTSQPVTATFISGGTAVYGDAIDLWSLIDGNSIMSGSDKLTLVELKEIAYITATYGSVVITATKDGVTVSGSTRAGIGNYRLRLLSNSDDHDVTSTGSAVYFKITARNVTFATEAVTDHRYGNTYSTSNRPINIIEGSVLEGDNLNTKFQIGAINNSHFSIISELDREPAGTKYIIVKVGNIGSILYDESNGYYYYETNVGNYRVKSIASDFIIKPRLITLTFNDALLTYGDSIDLWKREKTVSENSEAYYSTYDYVSANNLFIVYSGSGIDKTLSDNLKDVVDLKLFYNNVSYDPAVDKIHAATYAYKATIKNANYIIADGDNEVTEYVGGRFVVNKKEITIDTVSSVSSIVYGGAFDVDSLSFNVVTSNGLVNGDTEADLGVTLGIFSGASNVTESISSQNVGTGYVIDVVGYTNKDYEITVGGKASLAITKRSANVTANDVTGHVYGNAYTGMLGFTPEAINGDRGFVSDAHWQALNITASVSGDIASFAAGSHTITLTIGNTANIVNSNYDINLVDGTFEVVKRAITITANSVDKHVYGKDLGENELQFTVTMTDGSAADAIVSDADKASLNISLKIYNGANPVDNSAVASLIAGEYDLIVSYSENDNYDVTVENGRFNVVTLKLVIRYNTVYSVYGSKITLDDLKNNKAYELVDGELLDGDSLIVTAVKSDDSSQSLFADRAPAGRYVVKVEKPNDNYEIEYQNGFEGGNTGAYRINQRPVYLTANSVTHVYGDPLGANELSYTKASESEYDVLEADKNSIGVTFKIALNDGSFVSDDDIQGLDVGSYEICMTFGDNPNYLLTAYQGGKFEVTARSATVTPNEVLNHVYGETAEELTYTGNGFVNNSHLTALGITAQVYNGDTPVTNVATLHKGSYTIRLSYPEANKNSNYVVTLETANYVVVAREITVKANNLTHTYGDALGGKLVGAYTLSVTNGTGSVIVNGDNLNIDLAVYNGASKVEAADVAKLAVKDGGYVINVSYDVSNADYLVTATGGTFTVEKRVLKITFTDNGGSSVYGEAIDLNSGVYTHDNNLVNGNVIDDVITVLSSVTSTSNVGDYTVTISVKNNNYEANYVGGNTTGKYSITPRSIVITPSDLSHVYGDALGNKLVNAYTVSKGVSSYTGNAIVGSDDLKIKLDVYSGASKVETADVAKLAANGSYTIKASYDTANNNYTVNAEAVGTFSVNQRVITIQFVDGSSVYGTVVSESALDGLRNIVNGSLVNGDTLTVTAKQGDHNLTDTNAPAGTYTVTVEASDNYAISYQGSASGSYVVNKKTLTAALEHSNVEYREDGSDYHNGEYGALLNAKINIGGVAAGDSLALNSGYTVAYTQSGKAVTPNKAGKYDVTVTLTNPNYTFGSGEALTNDVTLNYEIIKKVLYASELVWNETMKVLGAGDSVSEVYVNYIPNYIDAIMEVVSNGVYKLIAGNENPQYLAANGNAEKANSYYFENGMLHVAVQGRARYVAKFRLTTVASANYVIDGADEQGVVEAMFFIVDKEIVISISTEGWEYTDEPKSPEIYINNEEPLYGWTVQYARLTLTDEQLAEFMSEKNSAGFKGFEPAVFDGMYDSLSDLANITFDVGYYLVYVVYDGLQQDSAADEDWTLVKVEICDIIEVSKKQIEITLDLGSTKFNGEIQSQEVFLNGWDEFVTLASTSMGSNFILGKDVKTYTKEVTIKQEYADRYVWKNSMNADEAGTVTVTWKITIDDGSNDDNSYFEVGQIAQTVYGNDVAKSGAELKSDKKGYAGSFVWYYALKGRFTSATDTGISWLSWTDAQKPVNAGDYFVKVTFTDNGKNFTDKHAYGEFTIAKATLYLTPGGTMVYGNIPVQSDAKSTLRGFVGETGEKPLEEVGEIVRVVNNGLIYALVDENGNPLDESVKNKMDVNTYRLIVLTNKGFVVGLEADNYNIVMGVEYGDFTVTPKTISIEIGKASGQFGVDPVLEGVTITYVADENGVKTDEQIVVEGVRNAMKISGNVLDGCGTYAICADYNTEQNKNFVINYTDGEYTVTPRKVNVTLNSGGGTYNKPNSFVPVTIASVLDGNGNAFANVRDDGASYVITIGESSYTITVVYNGTANDNTQFNNSVAYPTLAGSYSATVTGSGSDDFEIVGEVAAAFNVGKFVVDKNMIEVQEIVYTGRPLLPNISVKTGADFDTSVFTVQEHEDYIEARDDYPITLKLNDFANYKWSDGESEDTTVTFVILRAGIYATPAGNIVYGTAFDQSTVIWKFVYAANGAAVPDDVISQITIGAVEFIFDKDIDLSRPIADTYKITCAVDASGRIVGLTHSNYNITLQPNENAKYGDYAVNKKPITILAGSSDSVYSQNPEDYLSSEFTLDTSIANNSLVDGESLQSVITKYVPKFVSNVTADSKVGIYFVTADVEADNYEVSVTNGTHEILPIKVKLVLKAANGAYHGLTPTYGVAEILATNLAGGYDFTSFDNGNLAYYFTGTDGTTYTDSVLPTNAGKYVVTVTAINNVNGNFIIDPDVAVVTATFEIAKMVINEDEISIASKVYNGREQSHDLADGDGYTVSAQTFKNAGDHSVTLTLTNAGNYEWSGHKQDLTITKNFSITKAKLQLQPYGAITYGESFDAKTRNYGFELVGLLGDDEGADNGEIVSGTVKYLLANGIDGAKLAVKEGGYVMTADITELTSDNYDLEVIDGTLTVNRRQITIKPVASESVYGEQVTVSQAFTVEAGSLAEWDDASVIEYLAATTATSQSNAGLYDITVVTAKNGNYAITTVAGQYVVRRAKVGVSIRPVNGTYGDENNNIIEFMSIVLLRTDGAVLPISGLQFEIKYEGTANDKTSYSSNKVPTKAGIYTATVIEVLNGNYELDSSYGDVDTYVEIAKRRIDVDKITASDAEYTGKAIVPQINDSLYNVNGQKVYTVSYKSSMINVGTYDVTLNLVDTYNYAWVGNLNRTATIKFKIVKANNSLVDPGSPATPSDEVKIIIPDWSFGEQANSPIATIANDEQIIVFEYATSENGNYTRDVPQNAGEYWVRATAAATNNYNAFVSKSTKFVIGKKAVNLPVAVNLNENSVYTGNMLSLIIDGFDDQIMSLTLGNGMYRSEVDGKLNLLALNADTYTATFRLRNSGNYAWASEQDVVDGAVVVNWTVERKIIDRLPDASNKILVNGEDIVFIPDGFNSGIMSIEGNVRAHEGVYSAVVTLKDTQNYAWKDADGPSITVVFELTGTNVAFIAAICVVAGLSVGLAVMAVILTLVNRRKKRKEAESIAARSRADGWEE